MKSTITIKDVAKKAGVSISTVSRVINDSKPVTDEVKQKVLDVIKETGYIPNPLEGRRRSYKLYSKLWNTSNIYK